MAIIKCKMCGGDLEIVEGSSVCECTYCGTKQTVPSADNEKKLTLFGRAGRLLRACEFDKAAGVFETIVADFPEEAEAYWGLVLCKYGIEYVDDPATGKKIPTCHRSSFENVEDDSNYEQACENADAVARRVYREEARQIETLRKRILEVSGKEEPYDIFISYKELDEDGERTPDSVIAQDIYQTLTKEGYRVFFSRISLEGKLGVEYEPYIFAALNSAKVMIVVGTDYEYYDAVWVKNEWSRFLKLIASGQKKTLIPVYKDMDPYDMPKELRSLAAQNMGKIGAMQDLLHGIHKILGKQTETALAAAPADSGLSAMNAQTAAMLKRGYMMLSDGDYDKADDFFERVLNNDAECGQAYWGKALAEAKVPNAEKFGSALFNRLKEHADYKTITEPAVFPAIIAREADVTGLLKDFTDRELSELLSDLAEKPVQVRSAKQFFQEQAQNCSDTAFLHKLANSRDYDRAAQYSDEALTETEDIILKSFRKSISDAIAGEEKKESEAKTEAENRKIKTISIVRHRLISAVEEAENQRSSIESARREAEQRAEEEYQNAAAKFEREYQQAVTVQEKAYERELAEWHRRKEAFEQGHEFAAAECRKLSEKIGQLTAEKNNLMGLFTGKRRKELEDDIAALQKKLDDVVVPEDPGPKPEKPAQLLKGSAPRRSDYITDPGAGAEAELREQIKCSLSPAYKQHRESIDRLESTRHVDKGELLKRLRQLDSASEMLEEVKRVLSDNPELLREEQVKKLDGCIDVARIYGKRAGAQSFMRHAESFLNS